MSIRLVFAALLTLGANTYADRIVTTAEGDEIPITVDAAGGDALVLWLSSEFGPRERRRLLAGRLAEAGVECTGFGHRYLVSN